MKIIVGIGLVIVIKFNKGAAGVISVERKINKYIYSLRYDMKFLKGKMIFFSAYKQRIIYSLLSLLIIILLMSFFRRDSDNVPFIMYLSFFLFIYIFGMINKKTEKTSLILYIVLLSYSFVEFFTKKMTGNYFHEVPYEIISILYDTNLNEIKESLFLSKNEWFSLLLIFFCFLSLFYTNKRNGSNKLVIFQVVVFFLFFITTNNPIARTFVTIKNSKELIGNTLNIIKERQAFLWGAKSEINDKQTVILFLGETHRGDYLSINGYKENTTPNLMKENIISFNDAISQAAYTLQSTPMILSRKGVNDNGIFNEKSIISAFKEAGF